MKMKRMKACLIAMGIIIMGIGATITEVYAQNTNLDVTVSQNPNIASPDPYSLRSQKDDNEAKFYIRLESLTGANSISFIAYRRYVDGSREECSGVVNYTSSQVSYTTPQSFDYTKTVHAGETFYLHAMASSMTYSSTYVHAVGRYAA